MFGGSVTAVSFTPPALLGVNLFAPSIVPDDRVVPPCRTSMEREREQSLPLHVRTRLLDYVAGNQNHLDMYLVPASTIMKTMEEAKLR